MSFWPPTQSSQPFSARPSLNVGLNSTVKAERLVTTNLHSYQPLPPVPPAYLNLENTLLPSGASTLNSEEGPSDSPRSKEAGFPSPSFEDRPLRISSPALFSIILLGFQPDLSRSSLEPSRSLPSKRLRPVLAPMKTMRLSGGGANLVSFGAPLLDPSSRQVGFGPFLFSSRPCEQSAIFQKSSICPIIRSFWDNGIMISSLRRWDYRTFLNLPFPSPLFPESVQAQITKDRKISPSAQSLKSNGIMIPPPWSGGYRNLFKQPLPNLEPDSTICLGYEQMNPSSFLAMEPFSTSQCLQIRQIRTIHHVPALSVSVASTSLEIVCDLVLHRPCLRYLLDYFPSLVSLFNYGCNFLQSCLLAKTLCIVSSSYPVV
ncbi:PREDICTED: uncharacterized protein LOC109130971 [Camelina sativa]|uniref:Uncharacterized protein LOC109130971 n=1 Tax=Camelina sativa TaxID=90675 RepID=A0ABM1RCJ4_CAMSA|nr:PREDICTED: uncharacterized protein LOC109130971 [Camelina sativa]